MGHLFRPRDHERLESPGFVMEREGRFVRMASTLDAAQHAQMRQALGESVGEIKQEMSDQVDDLYAILHRYRPESVLGALWFRSAPKGYASGPHPQDEGQSLLAYVEYLATLYVRNRGSGTEFIVPPNVVEDIHDRVAALFRKTVWLWMAQDAARDGAKEASAARDLWFLTLNDSLVVRYPGHFDHMGDMLLGIESEMPQDLSMWLGWSIADAVAVGNAIIKLIDDRMNANLARGREEAEKGQEAGWPRGRGVAAHAVRSFLSSYRWPWNRERLYMITSWVQFLMQDIKTFSVDELANASGVGRDRVAALMRAASLPWGTCEEDWFRYPHPTPPILSKPCLELDGDRYLVPVPTSFLWSIKDLVEESLKACLGTAQSQVWDTYERARASFAEREAVRLLAKALPHAGAFHSLEYSWKKGSKTIQGELDGLLLADDTAIFIEVKAGTLSPEARRGAPDRLREQLEGLVGKAHGQALKALEFLRSAPTVMFDIKGQERLRVRSQKFNAFVLITVNLDPLDLYTANLSRLVDFGVIASPNLPWAVSYLDLVVIADAVEFPAQMLHYLERRQRVNELGFITAHDELDWFGHYLKEGLFFEHQAEAAGEATGKFMWNIVGYSEDLDAHYMYDDRYEGEQPPIPRQHMPASMRKMLRELENSRPHGYLHVSLALLDLSWEARDKLFTNIEELIRRTTLDGTNHNMTMLLDDGQSGLTFMCDVDRDSLQKHLRAYCLLKKYQSHRSNWVGIGKLVGTDNLLDEAIVIKHPWEYNDVLEQHAVELLTTPGSTA